jgi:uncharacterized damage-inducible protein DinB
MNNREFCTACRKAERPIFVRVLKAIPNQHQDYRPDPKSRTAAEIAWVMATEEAALIGLIDEGEVKWQESPLPASIDAVVAAYEHNSAAVNERLEHLGDAAWEKKVRILMGGGHTWEDTLSGMVWGFLFDAIHHRGQISTYLRPMGGKVPSIYGPSADDPGQ